MFGMLLDKVDGSLPGYDQERTDLYKRIPAHITPNLIPRPLPRFSLTAMENSLHGCEVLSGWRSGRKGTSFPRMLLLAYTCINAEAPQPPLVMTWQPHGKVLSCCHMLFFPSEMWYLWAIAIRKRQAISYTCPYWNSKVIMNIGTHKQKCERSNNLWWGPISEMHLLSVQSGASHTNLLAHGDIIKLPLSPGPQRSQNPIQVNTYVVHLSFHLFLFMLWKQLWGSSITYRGTILQFSPHAFPTIVRSH